MYSERLGHCHKAKAQLDSQAVRCSGSQESTYARQSHGFSEGSGGVEKPQIKEYQRSLIRAL